MAIFCFNPRPCFQVLIFGVPRPHPPQTDVQTALLSANPSPPDGPTEDSPILTGEIAIGTGGTVSGADMIYNVNQQWNVDGHTVA